MKLDRWKAFWAIAVVGFFGGAVTLVFTGDDVGSAASAAEQAESADSSFKDVGAKDTGKESPPEPVILKTADGCLADSATLADLRRQKIDYEARLKELNAREAELKTREQALNEQLKGLTIAREDLEKVEGTKKAENETKIAKLVETVESMNPKASSALLGTIDEGLAAATMARLSTAKLAKIMNVMDPTRSTRLSEILAGVARAKAKPASHDAAVATTERLPASVVTTTPGQRSSGPSKGGDTNDGKSHDQASNRTTADGDSGSQRR